MQGSSSNAAGAILGRLAPARRSTARATFRCRVSAVAREAWISASASDSPWAEWLTPGAQVIGVNGTEHATAELLESVEGAAVGRGVAL